MKTDNNHHPTLRELEREVEKLKGLTVKRVQSESNYPTSSLAIGRDEPSGVIPSQIQTLITKKVAEVIDAEPTTRTVWIIPHRGGENQ